MDANPALIAKIREDPTLYLSPGRRPTAEDLAIELANDAIYLGADEVSIIRHRDWTLVGASRDWLAVGSKWKPEECFFRLEFINQYRANSNRATVLLGAFAADLAIFSRGVGLVVLGAPEALAELAPLVQERPTLSRILAFRGVSAA